MAIRQVSGAVLRNKGVPIALYAPVLDADGAPLVPYGRRVDDKDEPIVEEWWLRLDARTLAELEENYDGLDGWQVGLSRKPTSTIGITIAFALQKPKALVLALMIDGDMDDYATAIGVAYMMANGLEQEQAGKVLAQGIKAVGEEREAMTARLDDALAAALAEPPAATPTTTPADTRGSGGSPNGSEPVEAPTSSGVPALSR